MENAAIWLSTILGPFMTIIGFWMLLRSQHAIKVLIGIKNSPAILYLHAVYSLIIGFAVLSKYGVWSWSPLVLVTLFGWVMVIRGILALFTPQLWLHIVIGPSGLSRIVGIIPLAWGLALCWIGFSMII